MASTRPIQWITCYPKVAWAGSCGLLFELYPTLSQDHVNDTQFKLFT